MASSAAEVPRRGRGRPARLSPEQIVTAAVDLLKREPDTALTIGRVATAVDSAPMALYRYFPDRDALLQAMADFVMADMRVGRPAGDTWQEQLRAWMHTLLAKLRHYSQLLPYMAATRRPVGVPGLATLATILRPARLSDEDLALALMLIGSTTVGYAVYESRRCTGDQVVTALRDALTSCPEREQDLLEGVLPQLPSAFARLHEVVIDQTVTAIEALSPSGAPPGR
ncbi:TetR/AcrR family transcriptional regulator [Streptosporangium sp. NBC_01639]|uniref:TetR/AcrR family transcriptional regulator n=1 Tax=Streptosporangium sp. NBC_01639 TaxID=2975948 RepID=UPI00386CEDDE|nr:TetR/AcrR family transcriptional regulator [Streptosporangium sp. NBC_01639]